MQPGRLCYVRAFTRVELLAVVGALALLAAIALPARSRPREFGQRVTCVNNLRQIARGWLMWAGEHGGSGPPTVSPSEGGTKGNQNLYAHFLAASNETTSPTLLICPSDERQHVAKTWAQFDSPPFRNNAVSYFAGMHVGVSGYPVLLAGDPNVAGQRASSCAPAAIRVAEVEVSSPSMNMSWSGTGFHQSTGNAAFGDGSVLQLTSAGLRQHLFWPRDSDFAVVEHFLLPP